MRTPMACCDSISREEQISRVSLKRTSTRSLCGSINARGKPWDSKLLPIDYKRCCSDQLNPPPKADIHGPFQCPGFCRYDASSVAPGGGNEAARIHNSSRRLGGVAIGGTRAAASDASSW